MGASSSPAEDADEARAPSTGRLGLIGRPTYSVSSEGNATFLPPVAPASSSSIVSSSSSSSSVYTVGSRVRICPDGAVLPEGRRYEDGAGDVADDD